MRQLFIYSQDSQIILISFTICKIFTVHFQVNEWYIKIFNFKELNAVFQVNNAILSYIFASCKGINTDLSN